MLLVGRVVQPHRDEDEEDEEGPDDFRQELELKHTQTHTLTRNPARNGKPLEKHKKSVIMRSKSLLIGSF